jgi:hypothetical protein
MKYKNKLRWWGDDLVLYAIGDYNTDEHRYVMEFNGRQISCESSIRDAMWMCIHNRLSDTTMAALKETFHEQFVI